MVTGMVTSRKEGRPAWTGFCRGNWNGNQPQRGPPRMDGVLPCCAWPASAGAPAAPHGRGFAGNCLTLGVCNWAAPHRRGSAAVQPRRTEATAPRAGGLPRPSPPPKTERKTERTSPQHSKREDMNARQGRGHAPSHNRRTTATGTKTQAGEPPEGAGRKRDRAIGGNRVRPHPAETPEPQGEEGRRSGLPGKADARALPGRVGEDQGRLAQGLPCHNPLYDRTAFQHHLV